MLATDRGKPGARIARIAGGQGAIAGQAHRRVLTLGQKQTLRQNGGTFDVLPAWEWFE
jgi:hypothetical protein